MPNAERSNPEKVGQPREKSDREKAADAKLLAELEKEKTPDHVETDDFTDYNPLAEQAMRLPSSVIGADGYAPDSHVRPIGGSQVVEPAASEQFSDDDDLGGGVVDPSSLTAD